jgi:hypothetical protein
VRPDQQHLLERRHALGGLAFLVQAEDRVEHRQAEDCETGRELLQRDDADDRGAEQDVLHEVAVLAKERVPAGLLRRLRELVRPVLRAPLLDVGRVEPGRRVDAELRARFLGGPPVPNGVSTCGCPFRLGRHGHAPS